MNRTLAFMMRSGHRFPEKADCLKIVDHKEIFRGYEQYLPTFNSSSIHGNDMENRRAVRKFIYFNDDTDPDKGNKGGGLVYR